MHAAHVAAGQCKRHDGTCPGEAGSPEKPSRTLTGAPRRDNGRRRREQTCHHRGVRGGHIVQRDGGEHPIADADARNAGDQDLQLAAARPWRLREPQCPPASNAAPTDLPAPMNTASKPRNAIAVAGKVAENSTTPSPASVMPDSAPRLFRALRTPWFTSEAGSLGCRMVRHVAPRSMDRSRTPSLTELALDAKSQSGENWPVPTVELQRIATLLGWDDRGRRSPLSTPGGWIATAR